MQKIKEIKEKRSTWRVLYQFSHDLGFFFIIEFLLLQPIPTQSILWFIFHKNSTKPPSIWSIYVVYFLQRLYQISFYHKISPYLKPEQGNLSRYGCFIIELQSVFQNNLSLECGYASERTKFMIPLSFLDEGCFFFFPFFMPLYRG